MTKPIQILLVEDNSGDGRLIEEMLNEEDSTLFEVTNTTRLDDGLKYLVKSDFDVILLDLCLPDSKGIDTFNIMKYNAPNIPIIVLTGLKEDILAVSAVGKGAEDYLVKGVVKQELLVSSILAAKEKKLEKKLNDTYY